MKKVVILIITILLMTGCKKIEKFYLNSCVKLYD